jgi:hypothetical protein
MAWWNTRKNVLDEPAAVGRSNQEQMLRVNEGLRQEREAADRRGSMAPGGVAFSNNDQLLTGGMVLDRTGTERRTVVRMPGDGNVTGVRNVLEGAPTGPGASALASLASYLGNTKVPSRGAAAPAAGGVGTGVAVEGDANGDGIPDGAPVMRRISTGPQGSTVTTTAQFVHRSGGQKDVDSLLAGQDAVMSTDPRTEYQRSLDQLTKMRGSGSRDTGFQRERQNVLDREQGFVAQGVGQVQADRGRRFDLAGKMATGAAAVDVAGVKAAGDVQAEQVKADALAASTKQRDQLHFYTDPQTGTRLAAMNGQLLKLDAAGQDGLQPVRGQDNTLVGYWDPRAGSFIDLRTGAAAPPAAGKVSKRAAAGAPLATPMDDKTFHEQLFKKLG